MNKLQPRQLLPKDKNIPKGNVTIIYNKTQHYLCILNVEYEFNKNYTIKLDDGSRSPSVETGWGKRENRGIRK